MKCNKCDHKLPDDSEFCQYCGSKIENYEVHLEESAEEIAKEAVVSDGTTEIYESDLPGLENATPEEALNAIIKIQAEETVKNLKENSKNQPNNEEDADFGLVPEKPIYTLALMSVDGELEYLNKLYTENGVKVKWNRLGSTSVDGVNGLIDIYDTYLPSGEPYKTIYINMYGAKRSEKAPAGFILNNVESKEKQKKRKKEKKGKTKYCSCCGSVIDNNTKVCTGCGKKYFRGIRLKPLLNCFFAAAILVSLFFNIILYMSYLEIDDEKDSILIEKYRLENEVKKFKESISVEYDKGYNTGYSSGYSKGKSQSTIVTNPSITSSYDLDDDEDCVIPGCSRSPERNSFYCFSHECMNVGCHNQKASDFCSYCVNHKCAVPNCNSSQALNSFYCYLHK